MNPDLKPEQMKRLQLMGQKMFEMYFCDSSPDCIGFENESKNQMKSIVYASSSEIVRLRTSSTLFQAYDHVMDILETKILHRFYRSPEVKKKIRIKELFRMVILLYASIVNFT